MGHAAPTVAAHPVGIGGRRRLLIERKGASVLLALAVFIFIVGATKASAANTFPLRLCAVAAADLARATPSMPLVE
jgi:hypothetical protein